MPISDEALQNEKNRFIAVKGEATVGQALAALNGLGGQPWWHVVARMRDGSWRVARFGELGAALESSAGNADLQLHDSNQLRPASVAERASLETKAAQSLARTSPARVLVVIDDGSPVGILVEGVRRGGDAARLASANLDQIGGKPVKLKDYSSILLGSSKK